MKMTRKFQIKEIDRMSLAEAQKFYDEEMSTMDNTLYVDELVYLENRIKKLTQNKDE
jgi:hypothetical protein